MVARDGEMFVKGEDSVKKELIKCFATENFFWISDIFPKEEEEQDE